MDNLHSFNFPENMNSEVFFNLDKAEPIDTTNQIQTDDIVFCLPNYSSSDSSSDSSTGCTSTSTCACKHCSTTTLTGQSSFGCSCDPTTSECNCVMTKTISCYAKSKPKPKKVVKNKNKKEIVGDYILKTSNDLVVPKGVRTVLVDGEHKTIKVILPHYKSKEVSTKVGELSKSSPVTIVNLNCDKVVIKTSSGQCIYKNKTICLKEGESATFQLHHNTWYKI